MACLLKCPSCLKPLKEEGDDMKSSRFNYRVYDNLSSSKLKAGSKRRIECLNCGHMDTVSRFN